MMNNSLEETLKNYRCSMSVTQVSLYLAGLMLGPEDVSAEQALEEILHTENDEKIILKKEDQDGFMDAFSSLWKETEETHLSKSAFPKLGALKSDFIDQKSKVSYINERGDELAAFYLGLEDSGSGILFDQCFELLTAELGISMMNELFGDFYEVNETNDKATDEEITHMLEVCHDLNKVWPGAYGELKQVFEGIKTGDIKLLSEEEIEKKMEEFKNSLENES